MFKESLTVRVTTEDFLYVRSRNCGICWGESSTKLLFVDQIRQVPVAMLPIVSLCIRPRLHTYRSGSKDDRTTLDGLRRIWSTNKSFSGYLDLTNTALFDSCTETHLVFSVMRVPGSNVPQGMSRCRQLVPRFLGMAPLKIPNSHRTINQSRHAHQLRLSGTTPTIIANTHTTHEKRERARTSEARLERAS